MEVKNTAYVTLQAFMVNDLKLSGNELIVYAVIYGFSQDGKSWFSGSRAYLAHWCQVSKMTVSTNLNKLVRKGLIEKRSRVENNVTFADYRAVQSAIPVVKNLDGGSKESLWGGKESLAGGSKESLHHTIDTDITREKIDRDKPKRRKYGEFGHVLLTDEEYEKLNERTKGNRDYYIAQVDSYVDRTGKPYKRYYSAVANFYDRDLRSGKVPQKIVALKEELPEAYNF